MQVKSSVSSASACDETGLSGNCRKRSVLGSRGKAWHLLALRVPISIVRTSEYHRRSFEVNGSPIPLEKPNELVGLLHPISGIARRHGHPHTFRDTVFQQ